MKPGCCWTCSLSFKSKENLSRQAQQKVSQGNGKWTACSSPRGKEMALESLDLPVGLWYSTNGFMELHHRDVGPIIPSGKVSLNRGPAAQGDMPSCSHAVAGL